MCSHGYQVAARGLACRLARVQSVIFERSFTITSRELKVHAALPLVLELNGFLNALRCVIDCPKRMFSATFIEKESNIASVIERAIESINEKGKLIESNQLDYKDTYQYFIDLIYKKISKSKTRALDNLDWNLVEYYGLISTADQEDGPWNRFISQEHIVLRFLDDEDKEFLLFFVEFSDFIVATQLGVSWNEEKYNHKVQPTQKDARLT